MQEYDLYINIKPQTSSTGLYLRKGDGLPDLIDPTEWVFSGSVSEDALSPGTLQSIAKDGYAIRNIG
jgi:hypothetical protein